MYAWAVGSLPLSLAHRLIFICLQEHLVNHDLDSDIRSRYSGQNVTILSLNKVTEGQACTVLEARGWIDSDESLLVYNADTFCRTSLGKTLGHANGNVAGLIGVFQAPGDKWSFARLDDDDRVIETAEKRRISEWATTGLYYFSRGSDFVRHADEMIAADDRVNGEFYVAPVYNRMLSGGALIKADKAEEVWVLGTPEDLAYFEGNYETGLTELTRWD
jgi:UDP-N-acetylglucosamine diphosphorylase / glucose-1-phosphate thymidylyltransferase / UDP-N-acetylgalactosamine diphosphorylase / glucosamine-1-phosphate N-acetyltransferase / galactosamine-1-phosphate N-acetyltransferase